MSDTHQEPLSVDENPVEAPKPLNFWLGMLLATIVVAGFLLFFYQAFPVNDWLRIPPTGMYHDGAPQFYTNPLFWLIFLPVIGIVYLAVCDHREHVAMRIVA